MRSDGGTKLLKKLLPVLWGFVALCILPGAPVVLAQDDEASADGEYLENTIVGRKIAVRLRAEIQLTEDDADLIQDDANYVRYPSEIYTAEAKVFQSTGLTASGGYSTWRNPQDMDTVRWNWKVRVPLASSSSDFEDFTDVPPHLGFTYRTEEGTEERPDTHYWYMNFDDTVPDYDLYYQVQFRHAGQGGESIGHQVYEYARWRPSKRFRLGEQAAVTDSKTRDFTSWYAKLFAAYFIVPDRTAVRLDGRYAQNSETLDAQEYNAFLYQTLGAKALVRLNYRFYMDSDDFNSHAGGLKLKYFFTDRVSAHIAYRRYAQSEEANFDTVYAGFQILL